MFCVLSLLKRVGSLCLARGDKGPSDCRKKISGSFYVEVKNDTGPNTIMRVDAKRLVRRKSGLFLYGWCHCVPRFKSVPVSQIVTLVDDHTGELIVQDEIASWLRDRVLH